MSIDLLNFLRIFGCIQATFVGAATAWIVIRYIPLLREATDKPKRLLAWHIIGIGTSYIVAIVGLCIDMVARFNYGMTWRLPLDLFVFTTGDAALCLMIWRLFIMRKLYSLL